MLLEHLLLPLSLLLFPFLGIVELVHIKTSLSTHEEDLLLTHHATLMQKVRIISSCNKGCQNLTIHTQLGINKPTSDEFGSLERIHEFIRLSHPLGFLFFLLFILEKFVDIDHTIGIHNRSTIIDTCIECTIIITHKLDSSVMSNTGILEFGHSFLGRNLECTLTQKIFFLLSRFTNDSTIGGIDLIAGIHLHKPMNDLSIVNRLLWNDTMLEKPLGFLCLLR